MRVLALTSVLLAGCDAARPGSETAPPRARQSPGEIPARVLTIRESSHPPTRALIHRIVVAGDKVRMTSELDRWRLFDLTKRTVTFVDEPAGTYRTVPVDDLLRTRRRQLRASPPAEVGPAEIRRTGLEREIGGERAEQWVVELGGYHREIWMSVDPILGEDFFRMWIASEPLSEAWAGVLQPVHEQLLELEGFPLIDRSRLVWEGGALLSQRSLVGIEDSRVRASFFEIPGAYEDATPPSIRSVGDPRPSS